MTQAATVEARPARRRLTDHAGKCLSGPPDRILAIILYGSYLSISSGRLSAAQWRDSSSSGSPPARCMP